MKILKNTIGLILISILLFGCGNYNPSDDDVVDLHGEITNFNKFQQFLNNIKLGNKQKIRVVRYTNEGDPLIHDLEYDGKKIISTIDTTRDEFGEQKIDTTSCKSIDIKEEENRIEYVLLGCKNTKRQNTILILRN
ncbi:hypothetical protein QE429_004580 [Bacillus sp. SORGH_AS 510]|uniref:DUF4362 domain-containing protein n=1 Tax=Bacillus sp. SORGH_AS_0510 TaxID=3041771 RepID=UPI002786EBF1|nr:DUF4362 domain-containing protein [Bacillus sp. SORGH_AS_0510]MDQ1147753.1 hypothetical protein [Bacillus sp. SORGH_AS_0510]